MNASTPERVAERAKATEWSVVYPNDVRVACESEKNARVVARVSSGIAQWRIGWQDADVFRVEVEPVRVEEPAGEPCDGSADCKADAHIHGCFSERVAQSTNADVRGWLGSDLSHSITHLFNEAMIALQDGEVTEAKARISEARESHHALLREIEEALPVGDETEALTREQYAWSCAEDMRGWAIRAEEKIRELRARVAGLEAREASLVVERDELQRELRLARMAGDDRA